MFTLRTLQITGLVVLIVLIFVANGFGYLNFVKSGVIYVSQPVFKFTNGATLWTKEFFYSLATLRSQVGQKRELEANSRKLSAENALLLQEREENIHLRQLLGLKTSLNFTTIAASVVNRDPTGIVGEVTIDRGSADGISPQDSVLDESGNLLGLVRQVLPHTARFLLVTDGQVKIDASVAGKEALGIVNGSHGLGLSLDLVSQNVKLEKGDKVVTSGLTGMVPGGVMIGYVDEQQSSSSELFQRVSVLPAANVKDFRFVLVLTNF